MFVFRESIERARPVLESIWPEIRAISDATGELYRAFSLRRASFRELLLAPRAWIAGTRAFLKGNFIGRFGEDLKQMPGAFLIENGEITNTHIYEGAGDHPDWLAMALPSRTA